LFVDYGLYYNEKVLIAVYVNDLILAGPRDLKAINKAKKLLSSKFDMKDLRECKNLLSMAVSHNSDRTVTISQKSYIDTILQEFRMENYSLVGTPLSLSQRLVLAQEGDLYWNSEQYQYLTNKLM
jgi:Reverse transcriptase (RNA-dependent DNA polymerase)